MRAPLEPADDGVDISASRCLTIQRDTAVAVTRARQDAPVSPSTGRFDVGGQRLATPPIRGRATELKVIGGLVTALMRGHRDVLVIEGPPGIGKSRLLTEVTALADRGGVRTLLGEAFEYQQAVPF